MAAVLDATYLPFTADQLRAHFAPVGGGGDPDRHLAYYLASVNQARAYADQLRRGITPVPAQARLGRQMEKDERFWLATALMSLYHQDGDATSSELFGQLLNQAGLQPPGSYASWADALSGRLELFFEVNLPSPPSYRQWLRDHLDERMPIPHLKAQAQGAGARLEGATKADAMLLAPGTGVAVIFEAKVLSDISTHVRFDLARNQLARLIDVLLDANPRLRDPLSHREPARTCLVLLTPALLHPGTARNAAASRLYGWLMPAYQDPGSSLLHQHLPHQDRRDLAEVTTRLGWASWEDCAAILPGACPWLTTTHART